MVTKGSGRILKKLVFFGAFFALLISTTISPVASAAGAMDDLTNFKLFRSLGHCIDGVDISWDRPDDTQLASGDWFGVVGGVDNYLVNVGTLLANDDARLECNTVLSKVQDA